MEKRLKARAVQDLLSWSPMTLHRRIESGEFPAPDIVDHGVRYWLPSTIERWDREVRARQGKAEVGQPSPR